MAAKKSTAKKKGTKKATAQKAEAKDVKSKPVPANKKGKEEVKDSAKDKNEEAEKSTHVSEEMEDEVSEGQSSGSGWKVAAVILAIAVVILLLFIGYLNFGSNNSDVDCGLPTDDTMAAGDDVVAGDNGDDSMTDDASMAQGDATDDEEPTEVNANLGTVQLLVLEDPSCSSCQVDLFTAQIEENLFNDLEVQKIDFESEEGQALIEELELTQLPAYLFDDEVENSDEWEQGLKDVFNEEEVEGETYYMVMPEYVQNKIMIEAPIITETAIVYGEEDAPVVVFQFTDFECPFCAIADGNEDLVEQFSAQYPGYEAPMPGVYEKYVEEGLVKVVFYNYPIPSLHPQAEGAHLASLCANEQDAWKEYSKVLWDSRDEWIEAADREEVYKEYAKDLGLDEEQFNTCLDDKKYAAQIAEEQELGQSYGVSGTPAFFIGRNFISGAQEYEVFEELIEAELAALEE